MYSPQTASQQGTHQSYRADGTLTSSVTPLLVVPVATSRAMLLVQNTSQAPMWMDHGPCRARATITAGAVTSLTITNAGFGYTVPPIVELIGGAAPTVTSTWGGNGQLGYPLPAGFTSATATVPAIYSRPAKVRAVLTAGVLTSFVIDDPGAGYVNPPTVVMYNAPNDPFGCADPSINISGTIYSGLQIPPNGGMYQMVGVACHTDQIALYGVSGSAFVVEWMP